MNGVLFDRMFCLLYSLYTTVVESHQCVNPTRMEYNSTTCVTNSTTVESNPTTCGINPTNAERIPRSSVASDLSRLQLNTVTND